MEISRTYHLCVSAELPLMKLEEEARKGGVGMVYSSVMLLLTIRSCVFRVLGFSSFSVLSSSFFGV